MPEEKLQPQNSTDGNKAQLPDSGKELSGKELPSESVTAEKAPEGESISLEKYKALQKSFNDTQKAYTQARQQLSSLVEKHAGEEGLNAKDLIDNLSPERVKAVSQEIYLKAEKASAEASKLYAEGKQEEAEKKMLEAASLRARAAELHSESLRRGNEVGTVERRNEEFVAENNPQALSEKIGIKISDEEYPILMDTAKEFSHGGELSVDSVHMAILSIVGYDKYFAAQKAKAFAEVRQELSTQQERVTNGNPGTSDYSRVKSPDIKARLAGKTGEDRKKTLWSATDDELNELTKLTKG